MRVRFFGTDELICGVPSGAIEHQDGMGSLGDRRAISSRCSCMASVSHMRHGEAAPVPRAGQMAPKMIGALVALIGGGSVVIPVRAHCGTRPFFWPMRASSWNQISIGLPLGRWAT